MQLNNHKNETDAHLSFIFPSTASPLVKKSVSIVSDGQPIKPANVPRQKFVERVHYSLDNFEYRRNGSDPGKVLIFNQEVFDVENLEDRAGSRRDVNEIIVCMQRLGFNIEPSDVYTDRKADEILAILDSVIADSATLEKCNSLIIFFLTHGASSEELYAKDMTIKSSQIWGRFKNCKELKNKPKMFILQCCKGKGYSTVKGESQHPFPLSPIFDTSQLSARNLGPDMLVVYATIEGNVSYRNPLTGTWFIQELCKNFLAYGRRDDVTSILTRINKCVTGNYYNYDAKVSTDFQKQTPVFVSTLTKKFYLNRNKERDILLRIKQQLDDIKNDTSDILAILKNSH